VGLHDDEPATLFDMIIAGDIPAAIVRDDDKILAFKGISPAAPAHVLIIIPKHRNGLTRLGKASQEHVEILGLLMVAAGDIWDSETVLVSSLTMVPTEAKKSCICTSTF
jgi:hypothetical protein